MILARNALKILVRNDPCLAHHAHGLDILHLVVRVLGVLVKVRSRLLNEACLSHHAHLLSCDLFLQSLSNLLKAEVHANGTLDLNPYQEEP